MEEKPLRYYPLLKEVADELDGLQGAELEGAIRIMMLVSKYFYNKHFYDNIELDPRAFVKTLEDVKEILLEAQHAGGTGATTPTKK